VHSFVPDRTEDFCAGVSVDAACQSVVSHNLLCTNLFSSGLNGSDIYKQLNTCYITALIRAQVERRSLEQHQAPAGERQETAIDSFILLLQQGTNSSRCDQADSSAIGSAPSIPLVA
jgi:hypothetical protein